MNHFVPPNLALWLDCVGISLWDWHSRQLLKMLRRDTVVGAWPCDVQECFATPTFIVTYTMCTLMTLITTTFLHLAVHNYTCTIAQPISTIATCILLTYMLPKEIETLTCNKSWLKHCISRYKTAVSGRATLCKHDNR